MGLERAARLFIVVQVIKGRMYGVIGVACRLHRIVGQTTRHYSPIENWPKKSPYHRHVSASSALFSCNKDDTTENEIEALQRELTNENNGQFVNVNSYKQISGLLFGGNVTQSVNRRALLAVIQGENPDVTEQVRRIASLVLEVRKLKKELERKQLSVSCSASSAISEEEEKDRSDKDELLTTQLATDSSDSEESSSIESSGEEESALSGSDDEGVQETGEMSEYESLVKSCFRPGVSRIDAYWEDWLLMLRRPAAKDIVKQIDPSCPMGFDPLARPRSPAQAQNMKSQASTTAGKKGSFLDYYRQQKKKYPNCVILVRCGDFYETFGVDAIMLMEHCGLNSMGGKAKAGCPKTNVQKTLDDLVSVGFRVAVFEEADDTDASTGPGAAAGSKATIKSRFLAQLVTSAIPTYLYNLSMLENTGEILTSGPASRAHVGIIRSDAGYTFTEVSLEERSVRVSTRLTAEAVACRLAAYPFADPLIYVPSKGEQEIGAHLSLPFLPSYANTARSGPGSKRPRDIINPNSVEQEGIAGVSELERAKRIILKRLLQLTENKENDHNKTIGLPKAKIEDFKIISSFRNGSSPFDDTHTNPLHLETATQVGLMNDRAIPSLISYLLPETAPAASRRYLRRLLLVPPPPSIAESLSTLVDFLKGADSPPLPSLPVPQLGNVLVRLRAQQASAEVFREILALLKSTALVIDLFQAKHNQHRVNEPLLDLVAYESGMATDPLSLKNRCHQTIAAIEAVVGQPQHANKILNEYAYQGEGDDLLEFRERNESPWRGRVRRTVVVGAHERVEHTLEQLRAAIENDFCGSNNVVYDRRENMIVLKEATPRACSNSADFVHPTDSKNRLMTKRYTTKSVQAALSNYLEACDAARDQVKKALENLSRQLYDDGHIPTLVQSSYLSLVLVTASHHASKANALEWSIGRAVERTDNDDSIGHFDDLSPYWMDRGVAEKNTFDMCGMWVLTAPNMSGKSTIMRSTAAAALLTTCGLCAPVGPNTVVRRFDHLMIRGASSDIPTENKSAFGSEMLDVAALIQCCTEQSLVFVDELCRGTSPRDGTALAAATLEDMAVTGISGVFATHLHDILSLPLESARIVKKRMGINEAVDGISDSYWTYQLEDGVCIDSRAFVTAKKFGIPHRILKRACEFSKANLQEPDRVLYESFQSRADKLFTKDRRSFEDFIYEKVGTSKEKVVKVNPGYSVPSRFSGKSVLYILELDTDPLIYYVGESDNIEQRIKQHRKKGGRKWSDLSAFLLHAPEGKTQARQLESHLINQMAKEGFNLESTADGRGRRHSNNSTKQFW